jgi:parallel beta-helix repeat protein
MKHTSAHMQTLVFLFTLFFAHTHVQANLCGNISIHDEIHCSKLEVIESMFDCDTIITSTHIFDGYTISTPGVYCLGESGTKTTAGNAITIAADNVVLDLNNHTITMVSTFAAISISGTQNNITIKNGSINTDANGIDAIGTITQLTILDMVISKNSSPIANSIGINLDTNVSNILIERCQVNDLEIGFFIRASNCVLNDCIARNSISGTTALFIIDGSGNDGTVFNNCTAINSNTDGFRVSKACIFNNCTATGCSGIGFWVAGGNGCTFNNCIAAFTGNHGFLLQAGISTLKCCIAKNNAFNGFQITSSGNILCNCLATENQSDRGFSIVGGSNNQLIECKATNNTGHGFLMQNNAAKNVLYHCVASGNGTGAQIVLGATQNTIIKCSFSNNGVGLDAQSTNSSLNKYIGNKAVGNTTGFRRTATATNTDLFAANCSYKNTTNYSGSITVNLTISTAPYWANV